MKYSSLKTKRETSFGDQKEKKKSIRGRKEFAAKGFVVSSQEIFSDGFKNRVVEGAVSAKWNGIVPLETVCDGWLNVAFYILGFCDDSFTVVKDVGREIS